MRLLRRACWQSSTLICIVAAEPAAELPGSGHDPLAVLGQELGHALFDFGGDSGVPGGLLAR